jgi:hypothetical protein
MQLKLCGDTICSKGAAAIKAEHKGVMESTAHGS